MGKRKLLRGFATPGEVLLVLSLTEIATIIPLPPQFFSRPVSVVWIWRRRGAFFFCRNRCATMEADDQGGTRMRVIAGRLKGRRLASVPGTDTRPTTDRVKEALFNIIGPYFSGGWGLDLYAGTGALGIEGLSRGLERVVFVDASPRAVRVIRTNLEALGLTAQADVYKADVRRALADLGRRGLRFDVLFLDPPYAHQHIAEDLSEAALRGIVRHGAVAVAEHSRTVELPARIEGFVKVKTSTYGDTALSVFRYEDENQRNGNDETGEEDEEKGERM